VLVADSSYFVALADRKDRWHADALRVKRTVAQDFLLSDLVVAESVTIVGDREGGKPARTLYEYFVDGCEVAYVEQALLREAMAVHLHFDGTVSVSDSVSVAVMSRRGIRDIVSFDRGFDRVRGIRRIHWTEGDGRGRAPRVIRARLTPPFRR
jgi:predicted nucleic acid-binding protein